VAWRFLLVFIYIWQKATAYLFDDPFVMGDEGVDCSAMSKKLTLVLPAHNEAGNIERVVASFLDIQDRIDSALTILSSVVCNRADPPGRRLMGRAWSLTGIPIKEVPYSHFPRVAGDQSGGTLRVMSRALPELVHVWRLKRGKGP